MGKRNFTKKEMILAIIQLLLIILIALIVVFSIPLGILFLIYKLLPNADVYLLTGLSVNIFICILVILIPFVFFILMTEKGNRINELKKFFRYKIPALILITIILVMEILFISGTIIYYKDIKVGPQESMMLDAVVKTRRGYKGSKHTYIEGYIDDEKVSFEITRSARKKVEKNKKYKLIKIYYYKNIKEAYDIDVFVSYS